MARPNEGLSRVNAVAGAHPEPPGSTAHAPAGTTVAVPRTVLSRQRRQPREATGARFHPSSRASASSSALANAAADS